MLAHKLEIILSLLNAINKIGSIDPKNKKALFVFRLLFNEIETELLTGTPAATILEILQNHGLSKTLTLRRFYDYVYIVRRERGLVGDKKAKLKALILSNTNKENKVISTTANNTSASPETAKSDKNTGDKNELIHMSSIPGFGGGAPKKPNY